MALLVDWQIKTLCQEQNMITPFAEPKKREHAISYGLSSSGYDIRLGNTFRVFDGYAEENEVIDPKNFSPALYTEVIVFERASFDLPPRSFALAHSLETINMPDTIMATCVGKSTYARCGLDVPVTPLEPGWYGVITLELVNNTPYPIRLYPGEGICQLLFHEISRPLATYAERSGKYQNQRGITNPIGL